MYGKRTRGGVWGDQMDEREVNHPAQGIIGFEFSADGWIHICSVAADLPDHKDGPFLDVGAGLEREPTEGSGKADFGSPKLPFFLL
jgi:hypothetical protein